MIGLAILFALRQAPVSLQYYQGAFLLQDGGVVLPVVTESKTPRPDFVRYRRGDVYAVWDKRGLSIRAKNWIYDTKLKELATTPKLFGKEAILSTLSKVKRGDRTLEASALAGSMRLGTSVFFVPRWIDKKGFTWLEALIKIDLSAEKPKPQLIGRFDGMSLASGSIDQRLFPVNEMPAIVVRKGSDWGLASYDPLAEQFGFLNLGKRLRAYALLDPTVAAYVEVGDDDLTRMGVADLESGTRNDMVEDRGTIKVLDNERPLCAIVTNDERTTLRNLQTSAAIDLPNDCAIVRTALGVLAYWPSKQPEHAILLDPARWEGLGNWDASATPPAEAAPDPSRAAEPPVTKAPPPTVRPQATSRKRPRL